MRINRREFEDVSILELSGEISKNETLQLRNLLETLIESGNIYLILDVENIRFLDSYTIMSLLRAKREALASGGSIVLLRPRAGLKRFLSIGQVLDLFECYETRMEAIRSFDTFRNAAKSGVQRPSDENPVKQAAIAQRESLLRVVELLVQNGFLDNEEFMQELYASSHQALEIYRDELARRGQKEQSGGSASTTS
ncbi:MAG: STAS domain-containing protein [bacterium]|nr:STAS domain-containing protein [bacterium]